MRFEVDALLFDIDGTLVDSTSAVERSWRSWAASRGLDGDEIVRVCHGRRAQDTLADILPIDQVPAAVAELEELELSDMDEVVALPGTAELLSELPADRWAAVTSGPRRLMEARLRAAGLPVPRVMVTGEDVLLGKPDPEGYKKAAKMLGFDPSGCLMVEDAPAGLAAARAAGGLVLAVSTTHEASVLERVSDAVVVDLTRCEASVLDEGLVVTVL